jgi:FkbM family methyltransferase
MDLYHHSNPLFTKWIVANGLLGTPFVVVDIGVQGGEHPRWQFLGSYVEIHGFDAIGEVVGDLKRAAAGTRNRHYHNIALGDEDGARRFFVSANRFCSSFYSSDTDAEARIVPIRRLDTLFRDGTLPPADYIKLDCEGFEPEILKGARQYLQESTPICVTTETNFDVSPVYPHGHFHAINEILVHYRLVPFDESHVRTPSADYAAAIAMQPWPDPDPTKEDPHLVVGRPRTYDIVFCPDLAADRRDPDRFGSSATPARMPSVDTIIKAMINFELHGLMDCAVELAVTFQDILRSRLDVEKATSLLLTPAPSPRNTADVTRCVTMIAQLRAANITAAGQNTQVPKAGAGAAIGAHSNDSASHILVPRVVDPSLLVRLASLMPPQMRRTLRRIVGERVTRAILLRRL